MKITITLNEAELKGIKKYLVDIDEINKMSTQKAINYAVEHEVKMRLHDALRDPRESISDYMPKD